MPVDEIDRRPLIEEVLTSGVGDWVYAAWVHEIAKRSGLQDENDLRALSLGLITEVLVRGLMVAGEYNGETHVPWACSIGSAIERIAEAWVAWGDRDVTPGAIVWLDLTDAGRDYLEHVRSPRD